MKKDLIFKTIALGAMIVGGFSIATAAAARIRRKEDEEKTANALVEAEVIAENFSGVMGAMGYNLNRSNARIGKKCGNGSVLIGGKCVSTNRGKRSVFDRLFGSNYNPYSASVKSPCRMKDGSELLSDKPCSQTEGASLNNYK